MASINISSDDYQIFCTISVLYALISFSFKGHDGNTGHLRALQFVGLNILCL